MAENVKYEVRQQDAHRELEREVTRVGVHDFHDNMKTISVEFEAFLPDISYSLAARAIQ